jgi:hypothetical protein
MGAAGGSFDAYPLWDSGVTHPVVTAGALERILHHNPPLAVKKTPVQPATKCQSSRRFFAILTMVRLLRYLNSS